MGVRYLQDDEYLLRRQHIEGNEDIPKDDLEELYQAKANKKFPLIPFAPYVWIYHLGESSFDSVKIQNKITDIEEKYESKILKHADNPKKVEKLKNTRIKKTDKKYKDLAEGNILMRWGEPTSVYDSSTIAATAEQMNQYLRNRGYFNSSVDFKTKFRWRKAFVTYQIEEDQPHTIDTVRYITADTVILKLIQQNEQNSKLIIGENYDQNNLTAERERIEKILKNNGFYDFSRQYITYNVITDALPYQVEVDMIINEPAKRGYHKQFKVDSVIFVTDAGAAPPGFGDRATMTYRGINYQYYNKRFSKKIIDQRVFIYPDSLYSLNNTLNTQRQLAYLDNFKFININYDTTGGLFVANIFTSPLQKYSMTNEAGLDVTQGLPGPFYNLSLKDRNVFGGLENLDITGYFGFEGVSGATTTSDDYSSVETGAKMALTFPQFIMPSSAKFKQKVGIYNPNTVIRSGFNYTDRPEYTRSNFTSALSYNWQKDRTRAYSFTLSELSFINSNTDYEFDSLLLQLESEGNPLIKSFEPSFVSAMNFFVIYNFNPDDFYGNKASMLKIYAETAGTIYNFFDPENFELNKKDTIQHFQYLKFLTDFRRHININENNGIATRLMIGVAYPYGENLTLPYEKFFFAGGSNSIRAWPPRRLGPGSLKPPYNTNPEQDGLFNYSTEKPGEILLEANVEYRSKLIAFIDWAFFIDAGNVWYFYYNPAFEGAEFKFNRFYKEIAVGMGMGLRLNFSFLVVRFDYGIKMYDPARDEGHRWLGGNISIDHLGGEPGQAIWNIAIGYPF
jgi:outer membrane protein insertion porin family